MEYRKGMKVLNDWEIVNQIGEGANGKVFEIQKTNFGITTKSALKVVSIPKTVSDIKSALSEGMDEKSVTEYFQGFVHEIVKEIAIMSEVKGHNNIVSYEDHSVLAHEGTIGWDILIRMELLTPMADYLMSHKLSEKEVIKIGCDLCNALIFCQKKGLIHRDIKPENIFVNELGDFKLGDFGIARTVEKTTGGLSKKGTESYMAPEIYLGKPYGSTVDVYSVGLVLYRLVNNNRLPFFPPIPQPIRFEDRENALSRRMKGEEIPTPVMANAEFAKVILKACAYKPEDRYHTAGEMLEALKKLKADTVTEKNEEKLPETESVLHSIEVLEEEKTIGVETPIEMFEEEKTIGVGSLIEISVEEVGEEEKTVGIENSVEIFMKDESIENYGIELEQLVRVKKQEEKSEQNKECIEAEARDLKVKDFGKENIIKVKSSFVLCGFVLIQFVIMLLLWQSGGLFGVYVHSNESYLYTILYAIEASGLIYATYGGWSRGNFIYMFACTIRNFVDLIDIGTMDEWFLYEYGDLFLVISLHVVILWLILLIGMKVINEKKYKIGFLILITIYGYTVYFSKVSWLLHNWSIQYFTIFICIVLVISILTYKTVFREEKSEN